MLMRNNVFASIQPALLAGVVAAAVPLASACSGKTRDADDASVVDSAATDAGAASPPSVICPDGTGNSDCCPTDVVNGTPCNSPAAQCGTACSNGLRGRLYCSGGKWTAGHGLFPCTTGSSEAGSDGGDAGGVIGVAGPCRWPESLNDAGPGVRACAVGRALVKCSYPAGIGCGAVASSTLPT